MERAVTNFEPRAWQRHGADQLVATARAGADRALVYACPGSGKTFGGLLMALDLIGRVKRTKYIIVITPNIAIKSQWIDRARLMGLELLPIKNARELHQHQLPLGAHGYIMNYQQAINLKRSLHIFCETHEPVVILDEVHHTAGSEKDKEGNAWGVAIEYACAPASFKICTTGTPFRQGNNPIAFVTYNEEGKATATVRYTYEQAMRDGVCRPIYFEFYDGEISWESKSGNIVTADFAKALTKKLSRERLEAALSTDGQFPFRMLQAAHEKLKEVRKGHGVDANAAGLVVAIDVPHANAIADVLEAICGERPVVVHNRIDDAQDKIEAFRGSSAQWIVGINMLSEGVDIPRLRVGVYATRITAPLYFHQFCGRFTRVQSPLPEGRRERSFIFLPHDDDLEAITIEIDKEKYHALGEEERARIGFGGSGRSRSRRAVSVEDSDAEAVGNVINGVYFPRAFVDQHRQKIIDFKITNPAQHDTPDIEVLKWFVDLGVVEAPAHNGAAA
jgi:superfamily II DNA or RNA helicase